MKWKKMLVGLTALSLMSGWMSLPEQAVISAVVPSLAIVASAESEEAAEYKDLDISVTSNKSEYSVNETAEITIVAKNTSGNVLKDVVLTGCIPDNLEVDENDKSSLTVKEIKPEESIELVIHVRYVDEGIDSTTESNLSDSNSSSEDNSSNSGSATNSNTSTKIDENPKTGSNIDDVFAIAIVAMLIAIVSMGFSKNKKVNKMLALLICVGMISSFVLPNISASAETNEDENLMSGFSIAMPLTIYFGDAHFNFTAYAEYKNPFPFSNIDITDVDIPFNELTEDESVLDYIDLLFPTKGTKELDISDDTLAATDVTVNYEVENGTAIVNITDIADYSYMSKVPGAIGRPVDISLYNDTLKQADIIFSYDESKLNGTEDGLGVCYYDEENNIVVLVDDVVIDTEANTVTVHTDHFSQWILIETNEWYDAWAQEQLIVRNEQGTQTPYYNVIFALDNSGSMSGSKMTACKEATKQFIAQLNDNDMISVTTFSSNARVYIENAVLKNLRNTLAIKPEYETTIDNIYSSGNTNFEDGLHTVLALIVNKGDLDNSDKSDGVARQDLIVFLSDGDPTKRYTSDTLDLLRQLTETDNLKLISLGLGSDVNEYYMKEMAEVGNGKYFFISDASEVADVFDEVNGLFIGSSKDTDEDGIPDIVESTGMRNQYGEIIKTDPNNPDSDGDEIPDGVEMGEFVQPPDDPDTGEAGKPYFRMTSDPKTPTYFSDRSKIISGNAEITFDYIRKDLEKMTIAQVADILKEYRVTYTALAVKHENSILSETVYENPNLTIHGQNAIIPGGFGDNCNTYSAMLAKDKEYTVDNSATNGKLNRDEVTVENTVIGTDGTAKSSGAIYFGFINYYNIEESYTTECVNTKTASDIGWAGISDFAANICDSKHETTIYITNNNGDIDGDSEVSTSCDFHEKFAEFLKERQAQKDRTTKNNRKKAQAELDKLGKKLETQAAEINGIFDEITTISDDIRKDIIKKIKEYDSNVLIKPQSWAITSITDQQLLADANKVIYEKLLPEMARQNQSWNIKGTDWFNFLKSYISSLKLGQEGVDFTSNGVKYTIKINAANAPGTRYGTGTITNTETGKAYSIMLADIDPEKYKESMEDFNDYGVEWYRKAVKETFKEALGIDLSVDYILKNSGYEVSGWKEQVTSKIANFLVGDFYTCLTHVDGYKAGKIAEALNKLQNEDYIYKEVYKKLGELARKKLVEECGGNQTLADMIWPEKDWWWTKEDQPWYKKYTQAIENAGDNDAMKFINALGSAAEAMEDANSGVPKAIEETSRRINDIKSILDAVPK
ncbi:MAG: VWA domain-containing protein [Ruminococcus sp.]|nr:VWA domain-containing protein [Ruminococcus sp.]